ncbi:alpha/beta hydrolase [Clostridium hydrogenum]|uniref:alpha/beta hydrolase n=1 Tax=Clostridium hydrogenum TaxID=2855764 RepID=UPI001F1B0419|nr:alpha/beta hydrolase [Clostridium hydrogenum]
MINKTIDIWENLSYNNYGKLDFRPTMDTYILSGDKRRPAVLIFPGGGYEFTSEREAEPIAMKYNSAGFNAFVLYYSVSPAKYPQPILDAARAITIIRENADEWKVDTDKIAVCGFSAGGHLAAHLGVHFDKEYLFKTEGIKRGLTRPNALILSYPVITSGEYAHRGSFDALLGTNPSKELLEEVSLEKQVSEKTPKTFIWHTFEDGCVPMENSIMFVKQLRKFNIPFEMHIYPDGGHGLSLATEETNEDGTQLNIHVSSWMKLSIDWINTVFSDSNQ